jgi:excinuclease ABC subunit A
MHISIKNCNTHNLKNVSVDIPLNKITCFSGPSGSGKSSLVFHTLANESKRRFLNSLPSSMNFFDRVPQSAEVESIEPVLPVWILPQNNPIVGSRLNLLDQLELTMDLAQLYFQDYNVKCPIHGVEMADGSALFKEGVTNLIEDDKDVLHFLIDKEVYKENISGMPVRTFSQDGQAVQDFSEDDQYWEIFRIKASKLDDLEKKLKDFPFLKTLSAVILVFNKSTQANEFIRLKDHQVCVECLKEDVKFAKTVDELIPFNGVGACTPCKGYGSVLEYSKAKLVKYPSLSIGEGAISILEYSKFSSYFSSFQREIKKDKISMHVPFEEVADKVWPILLNGRGSFPGVLEMLSWMEEKRYKRSVRIFLRGLQVDKTCGTCSGSRVSPNTGRYHTYRDKLPAYGEILKYTADELYETLSDLKIKDKQVYIDRALNKLSLALEMGLGCYRLSTKLKELETNEYQKSLLVRYLSYQGSGSLFVLDEPSLGLDLDEQKVLAKYLKKLSLGNTVVLVDHSNFIQSKSDLVVEMGPGAGHLGGEIAYQGKYRSKKAKKAILEKAPKGKGKLTLKDISFDEKKIKKIEIPLNSISTVNSYLESFSKRIMSDVVANDLYLKHFDEKLNYDTEYSIKSYNKYENFDDIIVYRTNVDRASGRSTVGTMLGLAPHVRKYFANLPVSKNLGLKDGHFSPNSDLGKCSVCEGKGIRQIDMQFLEDVSFPCDECDGKKLNKFYANITDGRITAHEAYNMPVSELFEIIPTTPKIRRILEFLKMMNLEYLTLDRTLPSLSGGERLRVKFLNTLQKNIENSLLIFTSLSYGLSDVELVRIRELMVGLCGKGNTIVLIDNHPIFHDFNKIDINIAE